MSWSRTIRFDREIGDAQRKKLSASLPEGVTLRFDEPAVEVKRTYALLEGPPAIEPEDVIIGLPDARGYEEAIIALAIEPTPRDALRPIETALRGSGAPAGMLECAIDAKYAIVEFRPGHTSPQLVLQLVDVELRRFHGYRRVTSLAPLPMDVVASVAAAGLQAAEIAPSRILESLLEQSRVE